MSEPIKAYSDGKGGIIYEYSNGRKERWYGGSKAWRQNNPGNAIYLTTIDWNGQIGEAGGFCIFSHSDWGRRAAKITVSNDVRAGKTLEKTIREYAPASENDTEAYIRFVSGETGIDRYAKLDMARIDDIMAAIFKKEGYFVGTVEVLEEGKKTGRYIWRTSKDDRVRASHKSRDGQIFEWSNPPPDGHPGEAFGCRCKAEDVD